MEENKSENQPAKESTSLPPTTAASVKSTPPPAKPAPEPQKETSKTTQLIRTMLIGLGVVAVAFLAGIVTYHFIRYRPAANSLELADQSVADLQTRADDLAGQLESANGTIATLTSDNQTLQSDLDAANLHIELLQALTEIYTAQIALANQDVAGAKVALSNTAARLEILKPSIGSVDAALADNISQRLDLINTSMDNDLKSAKADLGLLANNLINVETLLFGK